MGLCTESDVEFGLDLEHKIVELIAKDEKCKFVDLIKSQLGTENSYKSSSYCFCPSELLVWICHYDAVNCAAALVGGETGLTVDLNASIRGGLFPLHHAALSLSPWMTKFLYDSGAQVDIRCNDVQSKLHGLLPLNIAVESLSNKIEWTPKISAFRLICMLLGEGMQEASETVSFLARNTSEVERVIHHYVEEGKLVQFAALLIAASKSIKVPTMYITKDDCRFGEGMTLRRFVATEVALLIYEEHKLTVNGSSKLAHQCKEKRTVMTSMMLLLEIYERIGNEMIKCVSSYAYDAAGPGSTAEHIALLLKNSGFSLTGEDADKVKHLRFFSAGKKQQLGLLGDSSSPTSSNKVNSFQQKRGKLRESRSEPMDHIMPTYLQPRGILNSLRLTFAQPCQREKQQSLFSVVRSFHSLESFEASSGSELCTTMDAQAKGNSKAIVQHVPKFILSKKWSSFALAIKMGRMRI